MQCAFSILVGDSATYASYGGILYSKDLKTLVACSAGIGASIVIPAETETIDKDALSGCKYLASITVLGNVQKIDPTAFSDETKATAVVALPAGQDYDSRKATWESAGFTNFAEPAKPGETTNPDTNNEAASGLTYTLLDDYTLAVSWQGKDDSEANLEIPASAEINGVPYRVSTIAENAFANRGSLISVKLPTTITTINNGAFAGCANLTTIDFPNTLRTIGERAFEATSPKDLWLPASINSIGSRAFASCSSLERVVALGTPEVASDALAGCTNVSIYVPTGSEDSWNPGLPSDNNHLMPYGISLFEEPLTIEAGQEADLLEGGSLQAPDPIEVSYSYAAAPVSIDAGRVSAKKTGITDVTAVLSLDGIELTRATRTVEVSPNPEGEPDIAILNSEVPLPAAYLANARETQLNVTAPVGVTFGEEAPYDVAEGMAPASMESTADFRNNMDVPVQLAKIECANRNIGNVLVPNTGTTTLVVDQKLFSLYPAVEGGEEKAVHFGCNPPINSVLADDIPSDFTIQPKTTSPFVFRLNLTNDPELANAKVLYNVAEKNVKTHSLASVTCTFVVALLDPGTGNISLPFYLKDKTTGEVYTAAEVEQHANAIASGAEDIKAAYQAFMENEDTYECKTNWGDGQTYDVRIIGIDHDELSERSADGRSKAGLTFQFVDLLKTEYGMNSSSTITGGWGASKLRAKMNPGSPNDGEIWSQVPQDLKDSIKSVKKKYCSNNKSTTNDDITTSDDRLFLASACELRGPVAYTSFWPIWLDNEGSQYEYWNYKDVTRANCSLLKKGHQSASAISWWERSVYHDNSMSFLLVASDGTFGGFSIAGRSSGVCPCFCL